MKIKKAVKIESDQIYSLHQLSANFNCSYQSMKRWLEQKDIPIEKIGGTAWVCGSLIWCKLQTAQIWQSKKTYDSID